MIESKNFKSKQVSVHLYEFHQENHKYHRIETIYMIINEEIHTPKKIFERIVNKHDIKDKLFMMTVKNLEGVDMEFYSVITNSDGIIRRITALTPETVKFK